MTALAALGVAQPSARVSAPATRQDWRDGLPTLHGSMITLRELRLSDATALLASLSSAEVTRLISPPPPTVDGFEKFIAWSTRQRQEGKSIAYGVTLHGSDTVIGLFQVRSIESGFGVAEWGFALGSEFWGSGIFMDAARLVLDFSFDSLRVHRMEARAVVRNGRGNGALQKLGMVQEAILRRSFLRNGVYLDQACWALMADTWREKASTRDVRIVH
jgi:[ribosomal protein S5]-alanine N-acetyltransferase